MITIIFVSWYSLQIIMSRRVFCIYTRETIASGYKNIAEGEGRFSIVGKKYSFGRGRIFMYKQYKSGKGLQRRANEKKRKRERNRARESDIGMILFETKRKWMTEGLNSIPDTRAVVGKTVPPGG